MISFSFIKVSLSFFYIKDLDIENIKTNWYQQIGHKLKITKTVNLDAFQLHFIENSYLILKQIIYRHFKFS